ncbi:MAG TPA: FUSC family protein, partial [Acidobacteriaceae bacterium]|nr:FUSC family protein [Acidobacteriaceae bacterium]
MIAEDAGAVTRETESAEGESWLASFGRLMRVELSPYRGRGSLVLRMVLACTFVMFCIMVFRIPGGVLGAYSPMLISRDSFRSTVRSSKWIACACTLAAMEVILGAMLSAGSPFLHLVWIWASLFIVFSLVSVLRVYEAALAAGLFVTNTMSLWDQPLSADLRLRQTLFMLMAILLGCAVTIVIEYFFTRGHPAGVVMEGIQERIALAERMLRASLSDEPKADSKLVHELRRYATRGTETLRVAIEHANYSMEIEQRLTTAVVLSNRLVEICVAFVESGASHSSSDDVSCSALAERLKLLHEQIATQNSPAWIDLRHEHTTGNPILAELTRTIALLWGSFSQAMWDATPGEDVFTARDHNPRILVADAFSNVNHMKFAVRGTLSALLCYMLYMSVGWTGLNASIATCILTALPVTGASRHKQLMRFAGVVIGACVLGFAVQIVVLPQIDSILSYALLFAAMVCIGAWIGTSGPRIAFSGVQIVLAYEIVNLGRFSLNSSLIPARDTILGIALGIGAMWLIYDHLWVTTSAESVRLLLAAAVRQIAALGVTPLEAPAAQAQRLEDGSRTIVRGFDKVRAGIDASVFEAFPRQRSDELLVQLAKERLPQLRAALMIQSGLLHHAMIARKGYMPTLVSQAIMRSRKQLCECADSLSLGDESQPDLALAS